MEIWFHSFVLIGTCIILKYGAILNFIREPLKKINLFKELFSCVLCMGFWVGCFFGVSWHGPFILWGLYSSGICWLADHLIMILQKFIYEDRTK